MTSSAKPKKEILNKTFISSRQWAEERIKQIKELQDEYLDMYVQDKNESVEMLKLLSKIQILLEKRIV